MCGSCVVDSGEVILWMHPSGGLGDELRVYLVVESDSEMKIGEGGGFGVGIVGAIGYGCEEVGRDRRLGD